MMSHACTFIFLPKGQILLGENHSIIPKHLEHNVVHIMGSLKPIKNID